VSSLRIGMVARRLLTNVVVLRMEVSLANPRRRFKNYVECFEYLATELAWEVGDHHRLLDRVEDVVFQRLIQALGDVAEAQLGDVEIAILDFLLGLLLLASLGLPD
jgi:hypothetical protein